MSGQYQRSKVDIFYVDACDICEGIAGDCEHYDYIGPTPGKPFAKEFRRNGFFKIRWRRFVRFLRWLRDLN